MPPPKRPKTVYNARTKSVHTLKKKIRDGQRLLTRTALSADVAAETERALAAWQLELAAAQAARRERKLAQDYRMVRFFERQKATRKLRKLQREAASRAGGGPSEELQKSIDEAEVDVNYTVHFPPGERYIALFRDPGAGTPAAKKRDAIRAEIARKMGGGEDDWGRGDGEDEGGGEEEGAGDSPRQDGETEAVEKTKKKSEKKREKETQSAEKRTKKKRRREQEEETRIEDDDFFEF